MNWTKPVSCESTLRLLCMISEFSVFGLHTFLLYLIHAPWVHLSISHISQNDFRQPSKNRTWLVFSCKFNMKTERPAAIAEWELFLSRKKEVTPFAQHTACFVAACWSMVATASGEIGVCVHNVWLWTVQWRTVSLVGLIQLLNWKYYIMSSTLEQLKTGTKKYRDSEKFLPGMQHVQYNCNVCLQHWHLCVGGFFLQ